MPEETGKLDEVSQRGKLDPGETRPGGELYQRPERLRDLSEIYCELGHTLIVYGDRAKDQGTPELAGSRYAEAIQAFREAVRARPDSAELFLHLAEAYEAADQQDEALKAYMEAVRLAPDFAEKVLPLAHQYLTPARARDLGERTLQNWESALESSAATAETHAEVQLFLGRIQLYRDEYDLAAKSFERAREKQPHNPFILEGLGEALWRAGQPDQAVSALEEAIQLADSHERRDRQATTRLKLSNALMDRDRYREALPIIEAGLALDPPNKTAFLVALARCTLSTGEPALALETADQAVRQPDASSDAYAYRAAALLDLSRFSEALEAADTSLKIDPTHILAIRVKGEALLEVEDNIEQAIRLLELYVRQRPEDANRQLLLINAYRRQGQSNDELVAAIGRAIAHLPETGFADVLEEWAAAYLEADRPAEAIKTLELAAARSEDGRSSAWFHLYARALELTGRKEEALDQYQQGLALESAAPALLRGSAQLLTDLGKNAAAIEAWQQYAQQNPQDGQAYLQLAQLWLAEGNLESSLQAVENALDLGLEEPQDLAGFDLKANVLAKIGRPDPEIARVYYQAGERSSGRNSYAEAFPYYEKAKELDADYQPIYWRWADDLRMYSHEPGQLQKVYDSLNIWEEGYRLDPPDPENHWVYVSRALMNEQVAEAEKQEGVDNLLARRKALFWEAIVYCERALLLQESNSYSWAYLARFYRQLGYEFLSLDLAAKAVTLSPNNVSVLEESAIIRANMGHYEEALKNADQYLELSPGPWARGVQAFIFLQTEDYLRSIQLLDELLAEDPDSIWYHELRAAGYARLEQTEKAILDYQWIIANEKAQQTENLSMYGQAALQLALFSDDGLNSEKISQATNAFLSLLSDPKRDDTNDPYITRSLGICYWIANDLDMARKYLRMGVDSTRNPRELDEMQKFDLPLVEKVLLDRPNTEKARELLPWIRTEIERQQAVVAEGSSAIKQLQHANSQLEAGEISFEWIRIGVQASLARIFVTMAVWDEAIALYESLAGAGPRFPEAEDAVEQVGAQVLGAGDELLRAGDADQALQTYGQARQFEVFKQPGLSRAQLLARTGVARVWLSDSQAASADFEAAIDHFRASGEAEVGGTLGNIGRNILARVEHLWSLDDAWRQMAGTSPNKADLEIARRSLLPFLDQEFHLGSLEGESSGKLLAIDPLVIEMASDLIPPEIWEDSSYPWDLIEELIPAMRDRIKGAMGVKIPGVRVRGNETGLAPGTYLIMINEVPLVMGSLQPGRFYCPAPPEALRRLGLTDEMMSIDNNPLTGEPGAWVDPENAAQIRDGGLDLWDHPLLYMIYHLQAVIVRNLADLLSVQEVANILLEHEGDEEFDALAQETLPDSARYVRFTRLVRTLLAEGVSMVRLPDILRAAGADGLLEDDIHQLHRRVRLAIREALPGNRAKDSRVEAPQGFEERVAKGLVAQDGKHFLALSPELTQDLLSDFRLFAGEQADSFTLVVQDSDTRPFVRLLIELEFPRIDVIAEEEVL